MSEATAGSDVVSMKIRADERGKEKLHWLVKPVTHEQVFLDKCHLCMNDKFSLTSFTLTSRIC